jgi:uncharacterized protein (TIRG00374 family)
VSIAGRAAAGRRTALLAIVGLAISVFALWIVARDVDLSRTAAMLSGANVSVLAVVLGVIAVQATLRAVRWRLLLPSRADGSQPPVARVLPVLLVGYLGNAVLPARLGEVVRGALLARREGVAAAESVGSVVLERIVDVLVLAVLGTWAAIALAAPGWMLTAAFAATVLAVVGLAVLGLAGVGAQRGVAWRGPNPGLRLEPVARRIRQLAAGARVVDRPSTLAAAAALSLGAWLLDASLFWLVARALDLPLTPAGAMLVSAVAVLSTAVPTAPGYVGTFELAAVAAAGVSGITGDSALAFAVLAHVLAVVPISIAGAVALWTMGGRSLRDLTGSRPALTLTR